MSSDDTKSGPVPGVEVKDSVLQQIRQHARTSMRAEICGVLIGSGSDGTTRIEACIAGEGAAEGGAQVTYTQETWSHIFKVKDAQYPDQAIVGWYHSHPGFGVFLSDYDLFIHENFFGAPHQVAWVFDPHSDEEGCFGWAGKKVVPLPRISVTRQQCEVRHVASPGEAAATQDIAPVEKKGSSSGVTRTRRIASVALVVTLVILILGAGIFLGDRFGGRIRGFLEDTFKEYLGGVSAEQEKESGKHVELSPRPAAATAPAADSKSSKPEDPAPAK